MMRAELRPIAEAAREALRTYNAENLMEAVEFLIETWGYVIRLNPDLSPAERAEFMRVALTGYTTSSTPIAHARMGGKASH